MKRTKSLILIALTLTILLLTTACTDNREDISMIEQGQEILRKLIYADNMGFILRFEGSGFNRIAAELRVVIYGQGELDYIDMALILSFEDVLSHPEGIIVAWPGEISLGVVFGINQAISESEIDLSHFSLSYPISIDNLVYDWEKVADLWWQGLNIEQRTVITLDFPSRFAIEAQAQEMATRNLSPQDEQLWQRLSFALSMGLQHNIEGMRIMDMKRALERGEHGFTSIVIIHNSEEASFHPDDAVAFWPSELTAGVIMEINRTFTLPEGSFQFVNPNEFSLVYPLTPESFVDDWENVFDFWTSLKDRPVLRDRIRRWAVYNLRQLQPSQNDQ